MWAEKTGYCPVHNREVTITVEYSEMRVIGTRNIQRKVSGDKCDVWDPARPECSNCPIAYGSNERTP